MREVGLSSSPGAGDVIKVQHVFMFSMNDSLSNRIEHLVQTAVDGCLALGKASVSVMVPAVALLLGASAFSIALFSVSHFIRTIRTDSGH